MIEQNLRFEPIRTMLRMSPFHPRKLLVLRLGTALLLCGSSTLGQEIATFADASSVPALLLRVEGEPTIPLEKLRSELELATGKPVELDGQGAAGTIAVRFESDAVGAARVIVVYHPPLAELTRADTLPRGQLEGAHHIGLLAQGLIQRDAGITLLAPQPTEAVADRVLGSCASSAELARPIVAEEMPDKPVEKPEPTRPELSPEESWRASLGLHWGPLGFGTATGPFPPAAGLTRGALNLDDGGWLVGGALRVDLPSSSRFKFGVQAYLDQFSMDGSNEQGVAQTLNTWYIGLAALPSVRLTPLNYFAEIRFGIGVGFNFASDIQVKSGSGESTFVGESVGYRLGAAFTGTGWVTDSLGVTLTLGFDHSYLTGPGTTITPFNDATNTNFIDATTDVWLNQPYLRVAAEYRF